MMQEAIDKKSVIFYGAGAEAKHNLVKWEAQGLVPVCFADRDKLKHYTKFAAGDACHANTEEYDILPLDVTIIKYPNYVIYPTVAPHNIPSVTKYLLDSRIPKERIRYAGQYYKGLGCNQLGKSFVSYYGIRTCVVEPPRYFDVNLSSDVDGMYRQYKSKTDSFVLDNILGKPTLCKGCYQLQHGLYEIKPQLTSVNISSDHDDFCNSKCVYCVKYPKPSEKNTLKRKMYILDVLKYFTDKANGEPFRFNISGGEVSISSYCDEVMRHISENENLYVDFSTNAIVYSQSLADAIVTKRVELVISLDSGTPETMVRIRGLDCFESTVRNCVRYAQHFPKKTMLLLKYIIIEGINDNETDIRGFLNIAKNIGCTAQLSADNHNMGKANLSVKGLEMCYLFMRICRDNNIAFRYIDYYFNEVDRQAIDRYRQKIQLAVDSN